MLAGTEGTLGFLVQVLSNPGASAVGDALFLVRARAVQGRGCGGEGGGRGVSQFSDKVHEGSTCCESQELQ